MNSRQRRSLAALQHNDAISYEKWLLNNTKNQTRREEVLGYERKKIQRISASSVLLAISGYIASVTVRR